MTDIKPELKPCPFCGSTDIDPEGCASFKEEYRSKDYTWDKDATPDKIVHIPACNNCNATTDGDWNTRAPQAEIDVEGLKRLTQEWLNSKSHLNMLFLFEQFIDYLASRNLLGGKQ